MLLSVSCGKFCQSFLTGARTGLFASAYALPGGPDSFFRVCGEQYALGRLEK